VLQSVVEHYGALRDITEVVVPAQIWNNFKKEAGLTKAENRILNIMPKE